MTRHGQAAGEPSSGRKKWDGTDRGVSASFAKHCVGAFVVIAMISTITIYATIVRDGHDVSLTP
jgi:hypothetical protein